MRLGRVILAENVISLSDWKVLEHACSNLVTLSFQLYAFTIYVKAYSNNYIA